MNPIDGLSNLSDVMLCLAVGIMLALITHWNVDIGINKQNITELEEGQFNSVGNEDVEIVEGSDSYQHLGEVYQDPQTGKIYMITED